MWLFGHFPAAVCEINLQDAAPSMPPGAAPAGCAGAHPSTIAYRGAVRGLDSTLHGHTLTFQSSSGCICPLPAASTFRETTGHSACGTIEASRFSELNCLCTYLIEHLHVPHGQGALSGRVQGLAGRDGSARPAVGGRQVQLGMLERSARQARVAPITAGMAPLSWSTATAAADVAI